MPLITNTYLLIFFSIEITSKYCENLNFIVKKTIQITLSGV